MTKTRTMVSLATDYLSERRALGFDLNIPGHQITAFARFVDEAGHTGPLTTAITLDWVQGQAKHATPFSWARRLYVLRPFAKYLTRLDPATEFPHTAVFGRSHRRLAPHIYLEQEICDLLAAARRLAPHGGLRPATYETIFGLIAATGLRLSEALHLRCSDVDLDQGVLRVRNTKFRKSRHVPLHATAVTALKRYMAIRVRHSAISQDSLLFPSPSGGRLPKPTIYSVFQKLRAELGWTARGAHAQARIHDLRHTFICRRVQLWHEHGADIDNAMAALSTYVGHAKVSDTYWYLTGVPDLMAVAGKRFETFAAAAVGEDQHA
jgi:integrase